MKVETLDQVIGSIVNQPTPGGLVALQGALLVCGQQEEAAARALEITDQFHAYLGELQSKLAARDYSELASRLDIGAVGAVALENIVSAEKENFWQRLALGGIAEALMVAASRQYIKAWEVETGLAHSRAAWYLAKALWRASCAMQPDLDSEQRWGAIQDLLAPAHDPKVPASSKAVLLGRIFQILILTTLAPLLSTPAQEDE
jgi:hypothetical protein